ncbi:MAG: protein-glutamate O-methyltransferase CheR [Candidatus Omnitrophica bacterium]|nr:protein-glutamate O-methyltransferase CheR [Candidatus Omnitrophota bacterium]
MGNSDNFNLRVTDKEYNALKDIMYARTGVLLKPTKKPLILTRLRKRLEELNIKRFMEYVPLLEDKRSSEIEIFVNALTTNETYFFRHTKQFNFLFEKIFPEIIETRRAEGRREIKIWTAACSTGEEPYSIAIACREFFFKHPGWGVKICASDVNSDVLAFAKEGKYSERSLKEVPETMVKKYFREMDFDNKKKWQSFALSDEIKKMVDFYQHNLLKPFVQKGFDVIFLRNVMIYFDNESKQKVVSNIQNNLITGGYFFISLSESLSDVNSQLEGIRSGIYQKVK